VRAAGGVVWRAGDDRRPLVLLVHRPKYDDWTLPKGKAEPGESYEACALREVEEETGLRCTLEQELASSHYVVRPARPKTVRYWAMQPEGGRFRPSREVDEVRWLPVAEATGLLTYGRDRSVLESFLRRQEK